jgi:hypothetical protein
MATEFAEYVNKIQEETLSAVKQVQDGNLAVLTSAREFIASLPAMPFAATNEMPQTRELIESSFNFANRLLELRKQYALEVAEIFAKAQREVTQATVRAANKATNSK